MLLPRLLGVLLLALLAVTGASAQDVRDGLGIRLLEAPADRVDDPRALSYVIDHVAPGTTIERDFEVTNGYDTESLLELYPVAAEIVGDAFVPGAGREGNELSSWITVDPPTVRVAPRGTATATLRIDVPPDAVEGERYGVVLAERGPPTDVAEGELGVAARVGIRVYLSVGPGGEPATDFRIDSLTGATRDDGVRVVRAEVTNTGGRALDFSGELRLDQGPAGLTAGPYQVTPGTTLAPSTTVDLDVELDDAIPSGPWEVRLTLTSGTLVREATARLDFPDEAGAEGAPQDAVVVDPEDDDSPRVPVVAVGLGLLLLLLVALAVWLGRRRSGREPTPGPSTDRPGRAAGSDSAPAGWEAPGRPGRTPPPPPPGAPSAAAPPLESPPPPPPGRARSAASAPPPPMSPSATPPRSMPPTSGDDRG